MRGLIVTVTAVLLVIAAAAQAQTLLDRGSYLVNGIMTCHHCHTPKDKAGNPIMKLQFSGGSQRFDEIHFSATGSNITPDRETGIGNWSDADVKRALTEGVRPTGVQLATTMPYPLYKVLTPRDLESIDAYASRYVEYAQTYRNEPVAPQAGPAQP